MTTKRQLSRIVADLVKQGATVRRTKSGGWVLRFPNGGSATLHATQSDHHAMRNFQSIVESAGLNWPKT
jgi:hypothetical protein